MQTFLKRFSSLTRSIFGCFYVNREKKNVVIVCFSHGIEDFIQWNCRKDVKRKETLDGFYGGKMWRAGRERKKNTRTIMVDSTSSSTKFVLLLDNIIILKKLKLLFCLFCSFCKYFTLSWYHCLRSHSLCVGILDIQNNVMMWWKRAEKSQAMRAERVDSWADYKVTHFVKNFQHNVTFHRQRASISFVCVWT